MKGEIQSSDHLYDTFLDSLQHVHVLLMFVAPELDALFQMWPCLSGVQGNNQLPQPAGPMLLFIQSMIHLAFWAVNAHFWIMSSFSPIKTPRSSSSGLNPFSAQPVPVLWIDLSHLLDFALGLADVHELCRGPPLRPVYAH